jgi:aminoglycoside phosphotransferase (APT) family kinase protein
VRSHLSGLAQLHRVDWRAAGIHRLLPAPAVDSDVLVAEFDRWSSLWEQGRPVRRPIVSEFLNWLRPLVPRDVPRVSLTKGNNGVGEEVFRGNRMVALSDFELAGLSDPALDLAFSQGTLSLTDSRAALDHYERESSAGVTPLRLAYAQIWNRFKSLACLDLYFLAPFLDGRDPRSTAGAFGLVTLPRLERSLGRLTGSDLGALATDGLADAGAGTYH